MYLDLSKLHFTVRNWKIHIFHKIVKLDVVSWYLQHLKRGFCFCQDFVWCLCKKGNCQLFFSDWKRGPTSPEFQESRSVSSSFDPSKLWYSAHLSAFQSTLQLFLCCHLFDYSCCNCGCCWTRSIPGKAMSIAHYFSLKKDLKREKKKEMQLLVTRKMTKLGFGP